MTTPFDPDRAVSAALDPLRAIVRRWPADHTLTPLIEEVEAVLRWMPRRQSAMTTTTEMEVETSQTNAPACGEQDAARIAHRGAFDEQRRQSSTTRE